MSFPILLKLVVWGVALKRSDTGACQNRQCFISYVRYSTRNNSSSVGDVTTGKQQCGRGQQWRLYSVFSQVLEHYRTTFLLLSCFWVVLCLCYSSIFYSYRTYRTIVPLTHLESLYSKPLWRNTVITGSLSLKRTFQQLAVEREQEPTVDPPTTLSSCSLILSQS